MRVLQVTQPTTDGTAVVVEALTTYALRQSATVDVACPAEGWLAEATRSSGATWRPLTMRRSPHPSDGSALRALRTMVRDDYDVVVLHSSKAGALGRLAVASLGRHWPTVVFVPHGWSWNVGRRSAVYRLIEQGLARFADRIVAVSNEEASEGRRVLGTTRPIVTIPNGVDARRYSPSPVAPGPGRLLCVGRLTRQKGQDRAIRALALMPPPRPELRLLGEGPDEASLQRLAHDLGVGDSVTFLGRVSDPLSELRSATIGVFPSRWEGLSLAMLEAMSCGLPVVASGTGARELIDNGGALEGSVDDEAFAEGLSRVLTQLLESAEQRERWGADNRRTVLESYSSSAMVKAHWDMWVALSAARPPGRS